MICQTYKTDTEKQIPHTLNPDIQNRANIGTVSKGYTFDILTNISQYQLILDFFWMTVKISTNIANIN